MIRLLHYDTAIAVVSLLIGARFPRMMKEVRKKELVKAVR
jgi:hypothetical protein